MPRQSAIARITRLVTRPRPLVTRFTRMHAAVVRAARGRIRRSLLLAGGQPVLSLTTTGRRSGKQRSTVVAYLRDDDDYAVFGMNLGNERHPAWSLNLDANPEAWIDVDGRRMHARATRAHGHDAARLWNAYSARLPSVESFRAIAGREIPIYVLRPRPPPAPR